MYVPSVFLPWPFALKAKPWSCPLLIFLQGHLNSERLGENRQEQACLQSLQLESWLSHDFLKTFLWLSCYFLMTFSWLPHDFLMTFPWLSHDFSMNLLWQSLNIWICHSLCRTGPCFLSGPLLSGILLCGPLLSGLVLPGSNLSGLVIYGRLLSGRELYGPLLSGRVLSSPIFPL